MSVQLRSALCAAVAAVLALAVAGAPAADAKKPPAPITDFGRIAAPAVNHGRTVARSTCAVSVARFLKPSARADDTAAFGAAMHQALRYHSRCYPHGPSGAPQAVVYVPPDTYRIAKLWFPSNVRMEVDAAATLQEPRNRPAVAHDRGAPMIIWDSPNNALTPIRNVSIVGVGSHVGVRKRAAAATGGRAMAPFAIANDFTMNMDPATSGSTNYNPGMDLENVQYFMIKNVFTIQNHTPATNTHVVPWPTSARAVMLIHARRNSPLHGTFLEPRHGLVRNNININSPRGFGPNQVNSAQDVAFQNIYSRGGTALRIETDGSSNGGGIPDRGARVDQVSGLNIVGVNCNRAVSLAPHAQVNGQVSVDQVWALSCFQGVVASLDKKVPSSRVGSFAAPVVRHVQVVGGRYAQRDDGTFAWTVGQSEMPLYVSKRLGWTPHVQLTAVSGQFSYGR